jgi:hypothetical protein
VAISISDFLRISSADFDATGAFDAVLDIDSRLFIDPRLLQSTSAPELKRAHDALMDRFKETLVVLAASQWKGDPFWRQADRFLTFPERQGLCIGYSHSGTSGSGMGQHIRSNLLETSKQIINAGIKEPEIFLLVGLFEEGIGPDRISDMTAGVIWPDLLAYSLRVFSDLGVNPVRPSSIRGSGRLPQNPFNRRPIVLVPQDILSELPVALDRSGIDAVVAFNQELRRYLNSQIGISWKQAARLPKRRLREIILSRPALIKELVQIYRKTVAKPYDFRRDRAGEVIWYPESRRYARDFPMQLVLPLAPKAEDVLQVVLQITGKFKELIENNALSTLLYNDDKKPKKEEAAQKLFFGIADAYCQANNLDLSRESNAGRGPVDFKVSRGYAGRVLVETKLSSNQNLVHGFTTQLTEYEKAEGTFSSVFLVINVGIGLKRIKDVQQLASAAALKGQQVPEVVVVDARPKKSASVYQRRT